MKTTDKIRKAGKIILNNPLYTASCISISCFALLDILLVIGLPQSIFVIGTEALLTVFILFGAKTIINEVRSVMKNKKNDE